MMDGKNYVKQSRPFLVPTTDGKVIEEHFGLQSLGGDAISIAHMIAPPGWQEPAQQPQFDEYTLMISGKKKIRIGDDEIILSKGESLLVKRGTRVQYTNPFKEPAEYWAVCLPAFSIDTVGRQAP